MTTHEFLYSEPGDEHMAWDPEEVFETWHDPDVPEPDPIVIEKWTVHDPASHLPDLDTVIERVTEWAVEGNGDEEYGDNWTRASGQDDVRAAFRAALDLLAANVTYRMAAEKVGEHIVTWADDGTVLLDGQPMATPTEPATEVLTMATDPDEKPLCPGVGQPVAPDRTPFGGVCAVCDQDVFTYRTDVADATLPWLACNHPPAARKDRP